jgi:hypothetical protein
VSPVSGLEFGFGCGVPLTDIAVVHKFVTAGTFAATISKPFVICGLIAYCSICLLAVSSLPWIRNACYGVFRVRPRQLHLARQ